MARKKTKRVPRKRRTVKRPIFVSPDGGHTVYEQDADGGWGRLIEEDNHAKVVRQLSEDSEMWGFEAYALREKYPALQKAYEQYKTIYKLVSNEEVD